jgi:23S rRNA pseudouridine1911/1915/1917 synthase
MVMNERAGLLVDTTHVIQESNGVVAVWKPAGLATQAPMGIPSAESWLRRQLHGDNAGGYIGVPHRLDRGVSGVVLFAATPRAARKLSRQFERREIRKTYLAIVACGDVDSETIERMSAEAVTWRDMVEKIADEARTRIVPADEPGGREAVTLARLRCRLPSDRLLLELSPVTGRMHQLRLQAAARGLPIVGDDLYGVADGAWMKPPQMKTPQPKPPQSEAAVVPSADDPRMRPIALHACRISYADPDTRAEVAIEAALPTYWPESIRSSQMLPSQPV